MLAFRRTPNKIPAQSSPTKNDHLTSEFILCSTVNSSFKKCTVQSVWKVKGQRTKTNKTSSRKRKRSIQASRTGFLHARTTCELCTNTYPSRINMPIQNTSKFGQFITYIIVFNQIKTFFALFRLEFRYYRYFRFCFRVSMRMQSSLCLDVQIGQW